MSVNISGTFRKDDRQLNGLESVAEDLIEDPLTRHVVVGIVETKRIVKDISDGGTETPTVRLVQIEPLDGEAADDAQTLMEKAFQARTGHEYQGALFDRDRDDDPDDSKDDDGPL